MRDMTKAAKGVIYTELLMDASKAPHIMEQYQNNKHEKKGYLTHGELLDLIKHQELKTDRSVKGMVITLLVTKSDVTAALTKVDLEKKHHIKPNHLLSVLEAWEEMAEKQVEEREKATSCLIL